MSGNPKLQWVSPNLTTFSNGQEVWRYDSQRASFEEPSALGRLINRLNLAAGGNICLPPSFAN